MHKKLARIESTFLGIEDHGILTSWLDVKYEEGGNQGVGMYSFDQRDKDSKKIIGHPSAAIWLRNVLEVAGVDEWDKLPGKMLYVLTEEDEWNSKVLGIAALALRADKTFMFDEMSD